jgi:CheY-like chemotaxis protein
VPTRVLVIDDDPGVQRTVQGILEDEGYEVMAADDGLDALAKLDGFFPSLILLDITMPRMDGYTFAEELQRLGLHTRLALVVLTADGRARQKAQRVGAVGYLHKPFAIDQLVAAVVRAVGPA